MKAVIQIFPPTTPVKARSDGYWHDRLKSAVKPCEWQNILLSGGSMQFCKHSLRVKFLALLKLKTKQTPCADKASLKLEMCIKMQSGAEAWRQGL